jgi:glucose uptake protein
VKKVLRPARKRKTRHAVKGIVAALIAGIPLGLFVPILQNCLPGDLGLQAYAGMLLFSMGLFFSTIVYDFYFLNVPVEGTSLTFAAYFRSGIAHHIVGMLAGALVMAGLLSAAVALLSPAIVDVPGVMHLLYPLLSVPLAALFGIALWKELKIAGGAKMAVAAGLLLFLCGLGLFSYGFTH